MESSPVSVDYNDREEGEIVDDDFEDISDNSIIVPLYTGKSVSSKEHLYALSLSSVSDLEERKKEVKVCHRRKTTHVRRHKHVRRRRVVQHESSGSEYDSDDYGLDKNLQKQLQKAIRVDETEELHRNSLRTRLQAMTKLEEMESSSSTIEPSPDVVEIEKPNTDIEIEFERNEIDRELNELRIEALRTAVVNRRDDIRQKRKANNNLDLVSKNFDTNKENTHIENEGICTKKPCMELSIEKDKSIDLKNKNDINSNNTHEEDEDVLRALLLASISKKITKEKDIQTPSVLPISNNLKKTIETKVSLNPRLNHNTLGVKKSAIFKNQAIKVKPLIINVNADSDSDDNFITSEKTILDANKRKDSIEKKLDIQNTVDKFLKEQRAQVEAKSLPPKTPVINKKKTTAILAKSAVKLLPKVKQIEYQKLLQRLKIAEKKPRIRRVSHRINDVKPSTVRIVKNKFITSKPPPIAKSEKIQEQKTGNVGLGQVFKEIQIHKNGRLQIQEDYKALIPNLKRITERQNERKTVNQQVKRLTQELEEAKLRLSKLHEVFAVEVKDLLKKKKDIDENKRKIVNKQPQLTSTPIKEGTPLKISEISAVAIDNKNNVPNNNLIQTEPSAEEEEALDSNTPVNIGDPNDIDKIIKRQYNLDSNFSKYISPLDNNKRVDDDPLAIICPYEVAGMCRDPECTFKHIVNKK